MSQVLPRQQHLHPLDQVSVLLCFAIDRMSSLPVIAKLVEQRPELLFDLLAVGEDTSEHAHVLESLHSILVLNDQLLLL